MIGRLALACLAMLHACGGRAAHGDATASAGARSEVEPQLSGGAASTSEAGVESWSSDGLSDPLNPDLVNALLSDSAGSCPYFVMERGSGVKALEFVVDISGSMGLSSPTTNGATKWTVTRQALETEIEALPETVAVGMSFFPNMPIQASTVPRPYTACVDTKDDVPIASLDANHKLDILAALDRIQIDAASATPTHDALRIAIEALEAAMLPGERQLVLITDGIPTKSLGCVGSGMTCTPEPTDPIVATIAEVYQHDQIRTFIVGVPASERSDCGQPDLGGWLAKAARAGETAPAGCSETEAPYCHFDLSTQPDLGQAMTNALKVITPDRASCEFDVPPFPDGLNIDFGATELIYRKNDLAQYVMRSGLGDCSVGWRFTDSSHERLQICGRTCERLMEDLEGKLILLPAYLQSGG